ncbi:MAG: hypothetical protein A3I04_03805 [Nitrospinae bacterium RIFCSPLOWO2_02_FULL_39_110]|nr:MAG: hypothetical protein A2W53_00950 [Nitrospinae bacterium RIFCSPHIGHO2_02_39_11]OGW00219.1 MAG: hypothetical protein A3D97_00910 [Nitrospinae bacterium RIFCSPHIGHO2_12_FULL_39_42]OGW00370.1 MAG: hypothetical protein A3D20_04585 [Nitrospinae bacterium RIFCSPHIGHO2_02_FULL_39_82]OGW03739.1 MAG: hypothetical protein A2Z59_04855 [Nitrospinae bacterium RIFCSPLOWO2_02_39_17]OGW04080.1 MAG: hypothetical protein A3I04_03805 [Nitrospinae bacterium RIFCSPLOWO2_02_FULL_39_110]OGW08839.1 MAG: hypoth
MNKFDKPVKTLEILKSRSEKGFYRLLIMVFVCFASMAGQSAFAENDITSLSKDRLINIDLLGAVFGMARLEYQQNINEKSAWALRGVFWHSNTESWKWDAYGSGFSYRRYITYTAPEGGWLGGGIDLMGIYAKYMGEEKRSYLVFPHAEAGYTFSFKDSKWLATPSVSLGNHITDIEISNSNIPIMGAGMRLSVLLSYPF